MAYFFPIQNGVKADIEKILGVFYKPANGMAHKYRVPHLVEKAVFNAATDLQSLQIRSKSLPASEIMKFLNRYFQKFEGVAIGRFEGNEIVDVLNIDIESIKLEMLKNAFRTHTNPIPEIAVGFISAVTAKKPAKIKKDQIFKTYMIKGDLDDVENAVKAAKVTGVKAKVGALAGIGIKNVREVHLTFKNAEAEMMFMMNLDVTVISTFGGKAEEMAKKIKGFSQIFDNAANSMNLI